MAPLPAKDELTLVLVQLAGRTTTTDFRRLMTWWKRAQRDGHIPPGVAIADVLDLGLRALMRGRCPVPLCSFKTSRPRARAGAASDAAAKNPYRLCRAHRAIVSKGFLRVTGPPDAPSFFTSDGKPFDSRRA